MNDKHKSLFKIQQELKAPKGQFNSFGKYKYRSAEDILEALKPVLKDNNCILILSDELVNIGDRYYIKATATLRGQGTENSDESYVSVGYAREEESKKGMDGSQITGASSSYARKYALNGLFLIDDTKDSDSTNTGNGVDEKIVAKIRNAKTEKELKEIYSSLSEEDQPRYIKMLGEKKESIKK